MEGHRKPNLPDELVDVDGEECGDHDLVDVGRQVVVQEQGPVVEEEGHEVEEIAGQQDLADADKLEPQFWKSCRRIVEE